MKSFKFIPRDSLQVLFPENQKRMGSLNAVLMYSTLTASFSSMMWNYFNHNPVASAFYIPISLALYRWYYNYDYRKKRYDATFAQLLYDNNLSNNIGEIVFRLFMADRICHFTVISPINGTTDTHWLNLHFYHLFKHRFLR